METAHATGPEGTIEFTNHGWGHFTSSQSYAGITVYPIINLDWGWFMALDLPHKISPRTDIHTVYTYVMKNHVSQP